MRQETVRAAIVVFIASFCTLVIELVAGRVLAPYVGVSLYTWTSIIGVVLAGISIGAWAGGWLADRRAASSTLGWLLFASGIAALLIGPATSLFAADAGLLTAAGIATTLLSRVVLLAFLLFFIPSCLLGMISPVAVKLAVRDLDTAGRVVGSLYAISTVGAIAGTFTTGFWLVARFGSRATLAGVGVVLIASALVFGGLLGRRGRAAATIAIVFGLAYAGLRQGPLPPPEQNSLRQPVGTGVIHSEESQYYTIRVDRTIRDDTGAPLHALHLDHLVHSYADPGDPSYLEYEYLRTFREIVEWSARGGGSFRLLFVGGGGYTLPRLIAATWPAARMDVVEIDPAVTKVARRFFGVPRSAAIQTINQDARWFAMGKGEEYDAIFIDAFNDLSVPYHLTTREYAEQLRRMLRPEGALVANLIDDYAGGRFLASYVRTLQEVFGQNSVAVLMDSANDARSTRSTFVVVASRSLPQVLAFTANATTSAEYHLPQDELQRYVEKRNGIVLTDDYAPVDNMLAPLFRERYVDEAGE